MVIFTAGPGGPEEAFDPEVARRLAQAAAANLRRMESAERGTDCAPSMTNATMSSTGNITQILLDWYFAPFPPEGPPRVSRVVDAFIGLVTMDASVRSQMAELYSNFIESLVAALEWSHPGASEQARQRVAELLVSLAYGRAGLDTLGIGEAHGADTRRAADDMLEALGVQARQVPA